MRYLPISYDTKDKNLLVVGGGLLALSKIKEMLKTEFKIYVISDSFVDEIYTLQDQNPTQLYLKELHIDENFVFFSYDFLLIATTNFELNNALEERAIKTGILYERCDVLSNSNVMLNEIIEQEDIIVGISKERLSPAISEIIKTDIRNLVKEYNPDKIKILNKIRAELVRKNAPNIDETIKKLFNEEKINAQSYLDKLQEEDEKEKDEEIDSIPIIDYTSKEPQTLDDYSDDPEESTATSSPTNITETKPINDIALEKENFIKDESYLNTSSKDKIENFSDSDLDEEIKNKNISSFNNEIKFEKHHDSFNNFESTNIKDKEIPNKSEEENPMAAFHRSSNPNDVAQKDDRIVIEKSDEANSEDTFQNKFKSSWNKFSNSGFFKKK